ncbi:MAG: HdeD family acid-resistance protein [Anaerovoracaceae bacterium]|jgi:uncharacterized membrane protein HdeD (DUF308 family)
MSIFKKFGVITSLVLIAAGILFFVFREQVASVLAVAVGLVILVIGAYDIIASLVLWKQGGKALNLIAGIVMAAAGGYLMLNSDITVFITGCIIGVIAFIAGIDRFRSAYLLIREHTGGGYAIFSGIVHVAFGILMCIVPSKGVYVLVMLMGVYMIVSGILMLLSALKFKDL